MQDRFKFRVWDKEINKMLFVFSFDKNFIQATPGLVVPSIRRLKTDDCILMQCTGLKDRNGKLIYEGDIVKDIGNSKMIMEVKVSKCAFALENKDFVGYFHELGIGFSSKRLEVIGNIYENPNYWRWKMSNYEKLCETVNIHPIPECQTYDECPLCLSNPCDICDCGSDKSVFPEFTYKKQIELIELIAKEKYIKFGNNDVLYTVSTFPIIVTDTSFSEALAGLTLQLIETGELNKEDVRRILK